MKFFRLDLLTLLISLFILNSCKNQDTIGLPPGASGLSGSLVDSATILTNTMLEDSVNTSSLTSLPIGLLNDPVFGQTETDLITDLGLPGSGTTSSNVSYTVPDGTITIDSALLILKYATGIYGDTLTNYTLNVYQLNERQSTGQAYYSNKKWSYNAGTVLGTKTFQPRPLDSTYITDIVAGGADTLVRIPPQVRIPINQNFIRQNLFPGGGGTVTSNLVFKNKLKGFFINVDKNSIAGTGGTMLVQAPGDSSLAVYVRVTNGSVTDTAIVYLDAAQHASQISHSYSAQIQKALALTAQNAHNHTSISDSLMFLQGTASLRTKISFPYLKNLFKTQGNSNIIINRAELVVTPNPDYQTTTTPLTNPLQYLKPLVRLALYRYDIAHQPSVVEDADAGSKVFFGVPQFGGYLLAATANSPQAYHFLVTSYIQNLINGATTDYGTFIAPVDVDSTNTSTVDIAPTPQTAARTVAGGGANKSSPYRIKLNVIYTKANSK
jgi:hypothetical protein